MKNQTKQTHEIAILCTILALVALAIYNIQLSASDINLITGAAITRANISPMREAPCDFTLESGLNLVSFFCITQTEPIANVVTNITQMNFIFEYQETNPTDPWKSYNPSLESQYVQDLSTMSRTEGYWVDMNSTQNVLVAGALRVPTSISLTPGWNLAGYPTNQTKDINSSLNSIAGNYTEVRAFNAVTKTFVSFIPPSTGGLNTTDPYKGHWINITANEVWIVD